MNGIQYIVMPVSGAVIGYFTNWLAIKMLFRPHSEKRILGVPVPFTPGLIPKERYRLSKKVGETVGKHLLTKEVLFEGITSLGLEEKIREQLDRWVDETMMREDTISDVLDQLLPEKKAEIEVGVLDFIQGHVYQWATAPVFSTFGTEHVTKYVIEFLKTQKVRDIVTIVYPYLEQYMEQFQETYLTEAQMNRFCSDGFRRLLDRQIEKELRLNEMIPNQWIEAIEKQLLVLLAQSSNYLRDFFERNPEIDAELRKMTGKIVEENIGKLASMFVNQDKVYDNIKKGLLAYFENPENLVLIEVRIKIWVQNFMEKECNPFLERLQGLEETEWKEKIIFFLRENFKEYVFPFIKGKIQGQMASISDDWTLYDLCKRHMPNIDEDIFAYVHKKMPDVGLVIVSEIKKALPIYWCKTKKMPMRVLLMRFETPLVEIKKWLVRSATKMIVIGSDYLSQNMNIEQIVEDKINQLDVTEAEDIIISVVNKELQMITILGGVLGFIIGFLPLLIR